MADTLLLILLIFCIVVAVIFLLPVIFEKDIPESSKKCIVLPIDKDTENIELIARDIALKAAQYYDNITIILLDFGASKEQLIIFDKIIDGSAEYKVISAKKQ